MKIRKNFVIFIVVITCFIAFCSKEQTLKDVSSESQINELLNGWVKMWNSYDLDQVDKLFLNSSSVTYFSSEKEGVIKGIEAVREHHKGFGFIPGGKESDNRLWVEEMFIEIFESCAAVSSIWFFQRAGEDREKVQRGPMSIMYVKDGENYKIAHMHFGNYE